MAHSSWGSGWPNCQSSRINKSFTVQSSIGPITFPGGVRSELTELMDRLVKETVNRGYRFGVSGNPSYGCWGYNCRAISGTNSPSNHSWGLALDINAPTNPMKSPLTTDMPGWMPDLWNAYGFRWGGDYSGTPDAMHYEYMGSTTDAQNHTNAARANKLGEGGATPIPPQPPTQGDCIGSRNLYLTSPNMKGDDVTRCQQRLGTWGQGATVGTVDGIFGPNTDKAVRNFQASQGLAVDGNAGPNTRAKLCTAPPAPPKPTVPAFPFPKGHWMGVESNDARNHSGYYAADQPGIRQYQQRLKDRGWNIVPDGLFGPNTRDITIKYQREKGLAADGLAGEQTWHSIWTAPIT